MERTFIPSGSPYEPKVGFSRVVRVGDRVLIAGLAPSMVLLLKKVRNEQYGPALELTTT